MSREPIRYDEAEEWCRESIATRKDFLFDPVLYHEAVEASSPKFNFATESLHSLLRNTHLRHVKKEAPKVKRFLHQYLDEYCKGKSIKQLSQQANFPPYLMCRCMIEKLITTGKKGLTNAMRDPENVLTRDIINSKYIHSEAIEDISLTDQEAIKERNCIDGNVAEDNKSLTRLARNARDAITSDPTHGPDHDMQAHLIGIEYEVVLERCLSKRGITFQTESQLKEKGTSRTPDVLLSCPIGVKVGNQWKVVCWIDSKALFGDEHTHKTSVLAQAVSYVHRFGPGMVLYWFGHAPIERLGDAQGDIVIVEWELPDFILWPTGGVQGSTIPVNKRDLHFTNNNITCDRPTYPLLDM